MKSIKEKLLKNELIVFTLLLKDIFGLFKSFIDSLKQLDISLFLNFIGMEYFDILIKIIIVVWLFYILRQNKKLSNVISANVVITRFIELKLRSSLSYRINNDAMKSILKNFSKDEVDLLIDLGYVKKEENFYT